MSEDILSDDHRCWPCTIANATVGLAIAWVPLVAIYVAGRQSALPVAVGWGIVVTVGTLYRLAVWGYLPLAGTLAKATGLHERVGPGRHRDEHPSVGEDVDEFDDQPPRK